MGNAQGNGWWQGLKGILFGVPGSATPTGCLSMPVTLAYGLWRWFWYGED